MPRKKADKRRDRAPDAKPDRKETPRETARKILDRRGLSFPKDRKPVAPEAYHDLDQD